MSFERTRRLLARLLGAKSQGAVAEGIEATLDGRAAVALTEALVSQAAGLGGPAAEDPDARALFDALTSPPEGAPTPRLPAARLEAADGPRGAVATALGMALSGLRTTAFVNGRDLPAIADLLSQAAGQQAPLVVHAACSASGGPTRALADGHHGYHAVADAGAVMLFARDVQEAVDFALIARRLAETALVPVVVAHDAEATGAATQTVSLPTAETARRLLGDPEDFVDAATPAQVRLFGERRRRLVRWHDLDRPLLLGGSQGPEIWPVTAAARRAYFTGEVPGLLEQAFEAFAAETGRRHQALTVTNQRRRDLLIVAQGSLRADAESLAARLSSESKHTVDVLGIAALRPFPGPALGAALVDAKAVLVLERSALGLEGASSLGSALREVIDRCLENGLERAPVNPDYPSWEAKRRPRLYSATVADGGAVNAEDLAAHVQQILRADPPRQVVLGVETRPDLSSWPKRQALLDVLEGEPIATLRTPRPEGAASPSRPRSAPAAVRAVSHADPTVAGLARFWDEIGALYAEGAEGLLSPDPALGTGAMPALSASFRDVSRTREQLPSYDPAACTGCGDCWVTCPEGAIGAVAQPTNALLELGMALAPGRGADGLRPVLGKLAKAATRIALDEEPPRTVPALFTGALEAVSRKSGFDAERTAELEAAVAAASGPLADVPVSATDALLRRPEAAKRGSGALLSLTIDPDTCKGCALCIAACNDSALSAEPDSPARTDAARALRQSWSVLPDTAGAHVDAAASPDAIGPLAGNLLSRHSVGLVGGDDVEPGSGERQALRLVLAEAEAERQRAQASMVDRCTSLGEGLAATLRGLLDPALPVDDLDALSTGLEALGREDVDLETLSANVRGAVASPRVDAVRLHEVTEAARALKALAFSLREGAQGLGRARISAVLASGSFAEGLARFPHNPFTGPVVVAPPGAATRLARGLFEGQLDVAQADLSCLQRAERLKAAGARGLVEATPPPDRYDDLDEASRRFVSPVFVIGDESNLGEAELGGLLGLLSTGRPFKVIVLADPGRRLGLGSGAPPANLGLLSALSGRAYVAQSSVAFPEHFGRALQAAIAFDGPALLHLYAPSPRRDGVAPDAILELARLAVKSRVFPLFTHDPRREGVFGARIDLYGNPDCQQVEVRDEQGVVSPERWLRAQARFAAALEGGGLPARFEAAAQRWVADWRALQELAGEVTPFTARVEAEAQSRLEAEHAAAQAKLQAEHEAKVTGLAAEMESRTAAQLTDRLLALAGYDVEGPAS